MSRAAPDVWNRLAVGATLGWVALIFTGASTTGLLRAPVNNPWLFPVTYHVHRISGIVVGVLAVFVLIRGGSQGPRHWIGAALVGATVALGWVSQSFAPPIVAVHAFIAAFAGVPLTAATRLAKAGASGPVSPRPRWVRVFAQVAFGLVSAQVAAGALLRHQQISLVTHLLLGGIAVLTLLVPAAATLQDPAASMAARSAARWAIAAVITQVALGVAVLIMILVGPPSLLAWLGATIAHVTVGTLTLLAAAGFAAVDVPSPVKSR